MTPRSRDGKGVHACPHASCVPIRALFQNGARMGTHDKEAMRRQASYGRGWHVDFPN
jgi:hypothetical protein